MCEASCQLLLWTYYHLFDHMLLQTSLRGKPQRNCIIKCADDEDEDFCLSECALCHRFFIFMNLDWKAGAQIPKHRSVLTPNNSYILLSFISSGWAVDIEVYHRYSWEGNVCSAAPLSRAERKQETEIEGQDRGPIFILISRLVGSVGYEHSTNKTKWQLLALAEAQRLWAEWWGKKHTERELGNQGFIKLAKHSKTQRWSATPVVGCRRQKTAQNWTFLVFEPRGVSDNDWTLCRN